MCAVENEEHRIKVPTTGDNTTSDHKSVFVAVEVTPSSQGENLQKGK